MFPWLWLDNLIQTWSVWRDKNMQSLHPLKPLAKHAMVWCKVPLWRWKATWRPVTMVSPFLGLKPRLGKFHHWCVSGTDRILPSSVSSKMTGCNRIGAVFIDVLYIQLHLESNYCMIWEYHHLLKQSFGLCGLEIVCEFAGHSCASFRKQGVHVWVPVIWRSRPFGYYSFWAISSETIHWFTTETTICGRGKLPHAANDLEVKSFEEILS